MLECMQRSDDAHSALRLAMDVAITCPREGDLGKSGFSLVLRSEVESFAGNSLTCVRKTSVEFRNWL